MVIPMLKTWWKARKIMKMPKFHWRFRKWPEFYGYVTPGNPCISFTSRDVMWKDKYDTPRFEFSPVTSIIFFGYWQISVELDISGNFDEYEYWEQLLWMLYYTPGRDSGRVLNETDWSIGRSTWPWTTKDKEKDEPTSTWKEKFHL